MRIDVAEIMDMKRSERIKHVLRSKRELIRTKKWGDTESFPIKSDCLISQNEIDNKSTFIPNAIVLKPEHKIDVDLRMESLQDIEVRAVANISNWIDSQLDLILPGAPKKSIQENKGIIPFIKNHSRNVESRIGNVLDIYEEEMPIRNLGVDLDGTVSALIFHAKILRLYDENIFWQYVHKQINQHSISLQYVNLMLAADDENNVQEYENYKKYIKQALNPEVAEEAGFFWVVPEYKLIENSAVLFAANPVTPTVETLLQDQAADDAPVKEIAEPQKALSEFINEFKL